MVFASLHKIPRFAALAFGVLFVGCFDPEIPEGIRCSEDEDCPGELQCLSDDRCWRDGPRGGAADGSPPQRDGSPPPDADEAITIAYNDSTELDDSAFAACTLRNSDGEVIAHRENHYVRIFDLGDFGIDGDFFVEKASIGVLRADGAQGSQPVTVRVGHQADPDVPQDSDRVTPLKLASIDVSDRELDVLDVDIGETVPSGRALYLELEVPSGEEEGNVFLTGVNSEGEQAPSFFSTPDCGDTPLQTFEEAGFSVSWVATVTGVPEP